MPLFIEKAPRSASRRRPCAPPRPRRSRYRSEAGRRSRPAGYRFGLRSVSPNSGQRRGRRPPSAAIPRLMSSC